MLYSIKNVLMFVKYKCLIFWWSCLGWSKWWGYLKLLLIKSVVVKKFLMWYCIMFGSGMSS